MTFNPDLVIVAWLGPLALNATVVNTWLVMALLGGLAWLATRRLTDGVEIPRWQSALEVLIGGIRDQIAEVSRQKPGRYLPFVGTLFMFIATCNLLLVVPGFAPPTGSLSTTTALALAVFIAVPLFAIADRGFGDYLRRYLEPTPLMLPFNLVGEISRTVALAVRLYGNIMSGTVIAGILLSLAPFVFPVLMQLLGLLTGMIQAYIFAVLAMVYIASASAVRGETADESPSTDSETGDA